MPRKNEYIDDIEWSVEKASDIYKTDDSDDEGGSTSNESSDESEDPPSKSMREWVGSDFPNLPRKKPKGLNVVFDYYARGRKAIFKKKPVAEDVDPKCCDGISGICGLILLLLIDIAYVAWCCYCNNLAKEDDIRLLWLSALVWFVVIIKIIRRLIRLGRLRGGYWSPFGSCGDAISSGMEKIKEKVHDAWQSMWDRIDPDEETQEKKKKLAVRIFAYSLMLIFVILCLIFFVILQDVRNLVSLSGIVVLLLICVAISFHPGRINWQPVVVGIFVQLVFAVLTLQTHPGYAVFEFLGDRMAEFLSHSRAGSEFVFGDYHNFAFDTLPVVIYFSSFIAIVFHFGIIGIIIDKPSVVIMRVLNTTGPETLNAVANIFVSMTESPLITRPYMHMMTNSELMAIIVNGFASIAGSVLAAYINFGIPANHLLIACVMSAPAALAISKVIYPETKKAPLAKFGALGKIKSPYNNVLEAAMVGAMDSIPIVAGISANLLAFLSIYDFFNQTLVWLGRRACMKQDLTFELIFSYILWPIAFTMGVPSEDCLKIAELIGVKSMLNEFVAFERLGVIMMDSQLYNQFQPTSQKFEIQSNGSAILVLQNGTELLFKYGVLYTRRAEVIATYALCGFANVGSIGIMLGAMVSILPHRRKDLSKLILPGMIGGTAACFLTGCFAGLFFKST